MTAESSTSGVIRPRERDVLQKPYEERRAGGHDFGEKPQVPDQNGGRNGDG